MNPRHTSYWKIVHDCLMEFQRMEAQPAQEVIRQFRLTLADRRQEIETGLIYHQEPFYLAAQLAGRDAWEPDAGQSERYEEFLRRRTEEAGALGTDEEVIGYPASHRAA